MSTISMAMVKTFVMFIGELEYDNIFFDNVNSFSGIHYGEKLPYPTFSYFFLLAFVCIMPLIIMNLLVSIGAISTFFLDELRKFTISDYPKQTHFGYTLITLFFSYTLLLIHTSPKCFCAGCTSSGHWLKNNVKV